MYAESMSIVSGSASPPMNAMHVMSLPYSPMKLSMVSVVSALPVSAQR